MTLGKIYWFLQKKAYIYFETKGIFDFIYTITIPTVMRFKNCTPLVFSSCRGIPRGYRLVDTLPAIEGKIWRSIALYHGNKRPIRKMFFNIGQGHKAQVSDMDETRIWRSKNSIENEKKMEQNISSYFLFMDFSAIL